MSLNNNKTTTENALLAGSENPEDKLATERALLEDLARRLILDRHKMSIELGETLIPLKAMHKHGGWTKYFNEPFKPLGLNIRTAERYMRRARKRNAAADSKTDKLSFFKPASDTQAVTVRNATLAAAAEVTRVKTDAVFRLPLALTSDELMA